MSRLTLRAGRLTLEVEPGLGGAITNFRIGDRALMRPTAEGAASVLECASFPLVPFSNRIRGGKFACDGREIVLQPNMAPDPSPLHGQGWLAAWEVVRHDDRSVELVYRHQAGEWPWDYEARQRFVLGEDALDLELNCRNLSPAPMPCGLAFHPYFPCDANTVLDTGVTSTWTIDEHVLPVERVAATGRYSLAQRRICGQRLDHGFDGWNGRATIDWGDGCRLVMTSADAGRMQIYSPPSGGFFVCEPVQNANCALNAPEADWPALGIALLGEGDSHRVTACFAVG